MPPPTTLHLRIVDILGIICTIFSLLSSMSFILGVVAPDPFQLGQSKCPKAEDSPGVQNRFVFPLLVYYKKAIVRGASDLEFRIITGTLLISCCIF